MVCGFQAGKENVDASFDCQNKTATVERKAPKVAISQWKRKPGLMSINRTIIMDVVIKIIAGRIISIIAFILSINMPENRNLM